MHYNQNVTVCELITCMFTNYFKNKFISKSEKLQNTFNHLQLTYIHINSHDISVPSQQNKVYSCVVPQP